MIQYNMCEWQTYVNLEDYVFIYDGAQEGGGDHVSC